ncbi:MAG: hypothetical protein IPJ65_12625 [Archangiaceae bacterium]|nr:hypothetical protein [Archangiaceae bacterium]
MPHLESIPFVADVERLDGPQADRSAPPSLLVEVPHGADQRAHYDTLRTRLVGVLPEDLHVFFHVNTDIGAYQWGRRVAERVVAADPTQSAVVIRCLVPRTFIDTNRLESTGDDLKKAGLTAGVAPYVRHPRDVELLLGLHRTYVGLTESAYGQVCGAGGFALSPHTYGPRTMAIEKIDDTIVELLKQAHEPSAWEKWPVRPEVDIISKDPEGRALAPAGMVQRLIARYREAGVTAVDSQTYTLAPAAQGSRWAAKYPDRFLCLEVRRDLLVEKYRPFEQMKVLPEAADRFAAPVAEEISAWLRKRSP